MSDDSTTLRVHGLQVALDEPLDDLLPAIAERLGVTPDDVRAWALVKRSLDARGRPRWVVSVDATIPAAAVGESLPADTVVAPEPDAWRPRKYSPRKVERVVVVGAGPAGLFGALRLADAGVDVVLVDRGQPVETRAKDVSALMHRGELQTDSNICFGEGGAGTWSDGKLYTRVGDSRVRQVLETIVALGGPERILVDGRPHLGTDRLVALCKAFRASLGDHGCEIRFGTRVRQLAIEHTASGSRCCGVELADGERIEADRVILAVGHSARDLYETFAAQNVAFEPKAFAVGFRVEHPQALINEIQYGRWAGLPNLPTADYRLSARIPGEDGQRGVYSFCMCPGGQVVPSHTEPEGICVNGMSHASRKGHWANSALVVTLEPSDFDKWQHDAGGATIPGVGFQRTAEREAYRLGGGGFVAPAQTLTDFVDGTVPSDVRKSTYKPGVSPADLSLCYPDFVNVALREAARRFDRRMRGFLSSEALLVGVETRTSAPLRVVRDAESLQSVSVENLYPVGEGAGHAGGIVSAAIDGLRVAERILMELEA